MKVMNPRPPTLIHRSNSLTKPKLIMKIKIKPAIAVIAVSLAAALISPCQAAGKKGTMTKPDFLKGDPIPAGASHDWNLGATGSRGWMFSDKRSTADARQIRITEVAKGSPADGILAVGDVILGVAGKPFSHDRNPLVRLGEP
jgi:S1-C subfamily serine protease